MGFREWLAEPILTQVQCNKIEASKIFASAMTAKNIERMLIQMGVREDAADAKFVELVELVRQGSAAKDAEISALRTALSEADADATRRVDEALAADSEFDADKKEAGNTALESLVAMPAPEPTDSTSPDDTSTPDVPNGDPARNVPDES